MHCEYPAHKVVVGNALTYHKAGAEVWCDTGAVDAVVS